VKTLQVKTGGREEIVDVTAEVTRAVGESGIVEGLCHVFVPHTTAGVTVNENADPDVKRDMLYALGKIVPEDSAFQHLEGNSPAHVKSTLTGSSVTLIVAGGRLELGSWGGVYFCEFDGPLTRRLLLRVQGRTPKDCRDSTERGEAMTDKEAGGGASRLRRDKTDKLERLRADGVDPYPYCFERDAAAGDCLANADEWVEAARPVAIAGRLMSQRVMGKTSFGHLEDRSGRIQLFLRRDELGDEVYKRFTKLIEAGDHLGARGVLFRTRTGELSLRVSEFTLLAKAMQAMPEKYHGLQDPELRARQRYLDLAANSDVRQHFERRSRILRRIRDFFHAQDFVEVETPVLQPIYGGASARPFVTEHNALDSTLYLRIADELYLKRLIVGGMERVFEIGKIFRNEGMDRTHNPEFTMLEAYAAYWDYHDMMGFVEKLYFGLVKELHGGSTLSYAGQEIDFTPPWPRLDYYEGLERYAGRDLRGASEAELFACAEEHGIEIEGERERGQLLDAIASKLVESQLVQPTFLTDHPKEISPLAKDHRDKPGQVERFEPFIAGVELGNAFSELNDPEEQRRRFEAQMGLRARGDEEAQVLDEDFLRALEVGMPPTAGLGIGIDRLVMLLTDTHHIRDVLLFPMMRPEA